MTATALREDRTSKLRINVSKYEYLLVHHCKPTLNFNAVQIIRDNSRMNELLYS